jgi:hypothetical protein
MGTRAAGTGTRTAPSSLGASGWLIATVVALASFMEVLDTTIANVAQTYIAGGLGVSEDEPPLSGHAVHDQYDGVKGTETANWSREGRHVIRPRQIYRWRKRSIPMGLGGAFRFPAPNRQRSRGWGHNHLPIEWSSDGMR